LEPAEATDTTGHAAKARRTSKKAKRSWSAKLFLAQVLRPLSSVVRRHSSLFVRLLLHRTNCPASMCGVCFEEDENGPAAERRETPTCGSQVHLCRDEYATGLLAAVLTLGAAVLSIVGQGYGCGWGSKTQKTRLISNSNGSRYTRCCHIVNTSFPRLR
jgi:hypothetical protein